jgi:hypothetical protein
MDSTINPLSSGASSFQPISGPPKDMPGDEEKSPVEERSGKDTFHKSSKKPGKKVTGEQTASSTKETKEKEYTILAYMDGSNNLEDCLLDDVKEIESAPHSDNYNIAVQFSRFHTKGLTVMFLSEALGQAFKSKEFKGVLQQLVPDGELIQNYSEILKDSGVRQTISQILLHRNPELNDKLDALVTEKVKESMGQSRTLRDIINETAVEVLKGIYVNEQVQMQLAQMELALLEESTKQPGQKAPGPQGINGAQGAPGLPAGAQSLSSGQASFMEILGDDFGKKDSTVASDFMKAMVDLVKGGSDGKGGIGLFSAAGAGQAEGGTKPDNTVLFVEPPGSKGTKYDHDDYAALFGEVDDVNANTEPSWRGVRRYKIESHPDSKKIHSPVLKDLGQADMSSSKTLANFLAWGMQKYPAKHYIVLFSDHGAGFLGAEEDRGTIMSMPAIKEAFDKAAEKTGKKPDIIAFDTCLMAQAEVANELKDSAKYLIASEEIIGGDGYPYKEILPAIDQAISEGKSDPKDIAKVFIEKGEEVNEHRTKTLSAIDLKAIGKVVDAANTLAKDILAGKADLDDVRDSLRYTQHFGLDAPPMEPYIDFRDIWDLADMMEGNPNIKNRDIKKDLKELKKAVETAVVFEEHKDDEDYEGAHGISIYAPRREKSVSEKLFKKYDELRMSKRTKWNEFIKALSEFDPDKVGDDGDGKSKISFIQLPPRT